jgi:hypothetical protein
MNNLSKATKALREKSTCQDTRVRMITFTSDGMGFLLDSSDGRCYKQMKTDVFKGSESRGYHNSPNLMHFNFRNEDRSIDFRHVIYNKTLALIQSESLAKKVGMGTKALFHCSSVMRIKHKKAKDTCMFRHEFTKELHSVKDEEDFLQTNSKYSF